MKSRTVPDFICMQAKHISIKYGRRMNHETYHCDPAFSAAPGRTVRRLRQAGGRTRHGKHHGCPGQQARADRRESGHGAPCHRRAARHRGIYPGAGARHQSDHLLLEGRQRGLFQVRHVDLVPQRRRPRLPVPPLRVRRQGGPERPRGYLRGGLHRPPRLLRPRRLQLGRLREGL